MPLKNSNGLSEIPAVLKHYEDQDITKSTELVNSNCALPYIIKRKTRIILNL